MKIREGWHTYWKNPGDAGLPPRIEWSLPEGFEAGEIEWPAPERFAEGTLVTYGYHREVLFPVRITPPNALGGDSVTIEATFDWLECADVCLSASGQLRLVLPTSAEEARQSADAGLMTDARSRLPRPATGWNLSAEAGPRAISLAFVPPAGVTPRAAYFFVDQPLVVEHAVPQGFEHAGAGYRVTMAPAANASGNLARLTGVLVVERGRFQPRMAVQIDVPVIPGNPAPAPVPKEKAGSPVIAYAVAGVIIGFALAFIMRRTRRRKSHHT